MSTGENLWPQLDPNERKAEAWRDFDEACSMNDVASVEEFFQTGLQNASDASYRLQYHENSIEVKRCLLQHSKAPSPKEVRSARSLEEIKLFVEFGFDVKAEGHLVLEDMVDSREILDWLLDQGADINSTDSSHNYHGNRLPKGEYDHSLRVLNMVAARGDIETFDYLVSRGANPLRSLALHHASWCQDAEKTKAMISHLINKHRLDVNASGETLGLHEFYWYTRGDDGSALNSAVAHKNIAAIEELLKHGANPEGRDPDGKESRECPTYISIGYCSKEPWLPALRPLLKGGANPTSALNHAMQQNNIEAARICLECGADPVRAEEIDRLEVEEEERLIAEDGLGRDAMEYEGMKDEMRKLLNDWKGGFTSRL